jgi:hypothetical protein
LVFDICPPVAFRRSAPSFIVASQQKLNGLVVCVLLKEHPLNRQAQHQLTHLRHRIGRVGELVELLKESFRIHSAATRFAKQHLNVGSVPSKGNLLRTQVRQFFSKDFPCCRLLAGQ